MSLFDYIFSGTTTSITNFQGLLQLTGQQDMLFQNYSGGFTILIPTDTAFTRLNNATQQALFDPNGRLANDVIAYYRSHFNLYPSVIRDELEFGYSASNNVSVWVTTNGNDEFLVNAALIQNFVLVRNG
jgi:uncharacterized surface protein with fasciclin (FAS1) repeats